MPVFLTLALVAAQPTNLSLPEHTDIPDGFSTVICPSQDAAKTMLDRYHDVKPAPNNHLIDIDLFFQGLKATGCVQPGTDLKGTVTIDQVLQRKTLDLASGPERMIRYAGRNAQGQKVAGIVDEDGNNAYPRTELAEWMSQRGSDGWLDARNNDPANLIFYRCDSVEGARNVVASAGKAKTEKAMQAALKQALAREKCRAAGDRYFVLGRFENATFDCGVECAIELNALEAIDRSGTKVGLVFDGSLM